MNDLLWLFVTPLIASLIVLALPFKGALLQRISVLLSLIPLVILVCNQQHWLGSTVNLPWLPPLSIEFFLFVDNLSLVFLYLTAVIIPISIMAIDQSSKGFFALVLLLQGLLIGFFTARDLALFTIFWEAMLLPLYFIINVWGGADRQQAAYKFLIYMIAGSALMVAAVLALYFVSEGTFDLDVLAHFASSAKYAPWIFAVFLLAFAVKTPLFPFHGWLPDTYYYAPTAGTILLSALLSKAGIYGVVRIGVGLFPNLMQEWSLVLIGLAVTGVFYGALAAWRQMDYKRLIAYSSFSHVNFILVGLFVWSETAQTGAVLQALNHGVTITALFLASGWLQKRLGSTAIGEVGGMAKFVPHLCWLTLIFVLSSVALPGTNSFVGELLILFGLFGVHPWVAAFLALSVILSVVYMLRWMQKVYFQEPGFYQPAWVDLTPREFAIAVPLVALILWIGIYPGPVLQQINPEITQTLAVTESAP
ncbi:MAG: NADH-quinone oxidoreductase subunit M [Chlamydiales bacterium]|nr:NADH-quinone oxidoreductase subunit M [Chlamydiales bacterium]